MTVLATATVPVGEEMTPEPVSNAAPTAAVTVARMRNGEMPLFLTANEIMWGFQPLDGDREEIWYNDCECGADGEPGYCECCDEILESDDMLWERKYDEIYYSGREDRQDILDNGVRNPISLQWDFTNTGSEGLPEVLGGHHRIILMYHHKPHALMPVAFFASIRQAQSSLRNSY